MKCPDSINKKLPQIQVGFRRFRRSQIPYYLKDHPSGSTEVSRHSWQAYDLGTPQGEAPALDLEMIHFSSENRQKKCVKDFISSINVYLYTCKYAYILV